jgi:predicted AAA+ superfamily ATPase
MGRNMKKIIALWGSADSGKSSTLKIVHQALSKLSERAIENLGYLEPMFEIFSSSMASKLALKRKVTQEVVWRKV